MDQPLKNWIHPQKEKTLNTETMVQVEEVKCEQDQTFQCEQDQTSFKDNRAPKCARCRNHGVVNSLKGHKHFCQWKNCTCPRCQVVVERQKITAERVAFLRYQRKMKVKKGFNSTDYTSQAKNKFVDLGGMRYLDEINNKRDTEYKINDNDSERNSSGTPASISPPLSPVASSITSGDIESKSTTSSTTSPQQGRNSFCTDPSCMECWNSSPYIMNTKLNRLRSLFPMLTFRTLEDTLLRFRGNLPLAIDHLLKSLRANTEYENVRSLPCRDPNCRECDTVYKKSSPKSSEDITRRTSPVPITPDFNSSRKRPSSYSPMTYDSPVVKRPATEYPEYPAINSPESMKRSSPDIERRSSPEITLRSPNLDEFYTTTTRLDSKSKIILPPTLLKPCIDCSATISADDKFCGKCGYKQNS